MRRFYFLLSIFLFISFTNNLIAQNSLDSLLRQRSIQLNDYNDYREGMTERTWLKLVTIHEKAAGIIETDGRIINDYLAREIAKNRELSNSIEKLKLDIALLNKETEVQKMILEEKSFMTRTLLFVAGGIGLLFFVMLILYIDRQSRFRAAKMELEHLWKTHEDPETKSLRKDEINTLREQLFKTTDEIEKLKKEYQTALAQKKQAEKLLNDEITNRREAELEIKELIDQIKKV